MGYVVAFVLGLMIMFLLAAREDIKTRFQKRRINRRYERLLNGIPKRTVFLTSFDQMRKYREYPFYINGKVYGVSTSRRWYWHCNEIDVLLEDKNGKTLGYAHEILISRHVGDDGKVKYKRGISLSEHPTQLGKRIYPSAVIEVY
ncbi:hypothetical protein NXA67_003214 [Vibrio cholerae]|nr:hypothetical protein [Vibrio cholerae]